MIRCFLLEPTDEQRVYLRRYGTSALCAQPGWSYHDARTLISVEPTAYGERDWGEGRKRRVIEAHAEPPHDDPRWPTHCVCGFAFEDSDHWHVFQEQLWRRADTGELIELRDAPAGAMWYAWWMDGANWQGPDGKHLVVRTPGGDWQVDGKASNCTMPEDWEHRCWVRHGTPPDITVDKNGLTCGAGAGSIMASSYHGFLQNGHLT